MAKVKKTKTVNSAGGNEQRSETPRVIDGVGSNAAPQNPILHDNQPSEHNQLTLRDSTPGPACPGRGAPREEESTELCVLDPLSPLSPGFGRLREHLSLVPANYNSMHLRQQQDLKRSVNNLSAFLTSVQENPAQYLHQRGSLGPIDRIGSEVEIWRHIAQTTNILKSIQSFQEAK